MYIAGAVTRLTILIAFAVADRAVLPDRSAAHALLCDLPAAVAMLALNLALPLTLRTGHSFDVIHIDAFHRRPPLTSDALANCESGSMSC